MRIDLRPAATRFETAASGIRSRHAFSYGPHYDPANTAFGLLIAHNDDLLDAGAGYFEHSHRDVEIISWITRGSLRHEDDLGSAMVLGPGTIQRLSAGSGVRHAETNAAATPTRYIQMWIATSYDGPPAYASAVAPLTEPGFVPLASGREPALLSLRAPATFSVARLRAGEQAELAGAAFVHLSVVGGAVEVTDDDTVTDDEAVTMADGDTARIIAADRFVVRATADTEVLAWLMDAEVGPPMC